MSRIGRLSHSRGTLGEHGRRPQSNGPHRSLTTASYDGAMREYIATNRQGNAACPLAGSSWGHSHPRALSCPPFPSKLKSKCMGVRILLFGFPSANASR